METIYINGKLHPLTGALTVEQFIKQQPYLPGTFAVALNETFIPRSQYATTPLHPNDRIDIITAMQGG